MRKIEFRSTTERFSIMNPFNNFAVEEHLVEVRKDPLLGDTSIYNPFLKDKARAFFGENDQELIKKLAEETARGCIFCPEAVETKTAKYPPDLIPEGRIRRGEAVLFANLFSVGKYHPVIAMSKAHFLKPSEFTPEIIGNGFRASQQFLRAVCEKDASAKYTTLNANYLLPAGASLIHPHMQMLVTPEPYSYQSRLLAAADRYYEEKSSSYFADLIKEEKKTGSRYIARTGNWHWMTAFSPMGTNEVLAVHEEKADFASLSDDEITDLASGISRVLSFYEDIGQMSFNYTLFSTRESAGHNGSHCLFKIITRQNLYPNYRNDDYFLQKLLQSELIFTLPEELAEGVRGKF